MRKLMNPGHYNHRWTPMNTDNTQEAEKQKAESTAEKQKAESRKQKLEQRALRLRVFAPSLCLRLPISAFRPDPCPSVSVRGCPSPLRLWTLDFGLWTSAAALRTPHSALRAWLLALVVALLVVGNAWGHEAASTAITPQTATSSTTTPALTNSTETTNSGVVAAVTMDTLDDKYRLAIGDRLSFRIQEDEDEPKQLTVADSGQLEVPYIGRFPAENKTCKQLARELKTALEKEYYYQATVILAVDSMTRSRGKIYLVGPVRLPGPQEIPSDEVITLSKAIMRAGGFNDYADRHNVKVTRKTGPGATDTKTYLVDVAQILEKGKIDRDLPMEPGDLVLIPERLIRF